MPAPNVVYEKDQRITSPSMTNIDCSSEERGKYVYIYICFVLGGQSFTILQLFMSQLIVLPISQAIIIYIANTCRNSASYTRLINICYCSSLFIHYFIFAVACGLNPMSF